MTSYLLMDRERRLMYIFCGYKSTATFAEIAIL